MTISTRLGVVLLLVAAGLFISGSDGVVTITGTREVSVVTAQDAEAYLGIHREDPDLSNGRHRGVVLLGLRNNLPSTLSAVSVAVHDRTPGLPRGLAIDWPRTLAAGESGSVRAEVVCGGAGDRVERWRVIISATGLDTTVRAARTVRIGCAPAGGPGDGPTDRPRGPPADRPPNASEGPPR